MGKGWQTEKKNWKQEGSFLKEGKIKEEKFEDKKKRGRKRGGL